MNFYLLANGYYFFFFNDTATTEIYTLSLHDALPICTELRYHTPYELLVAVVLSAQATDKSVNQASAVLFEQFNAPDKMVKLGVAGLEKYIRRIGLYRTKAKNVEALSKILLEEDGGEVSASRGTVEGPPGGRRKTPEVVVNTAVGQPTV